MTRSGVATDKRNPLPAPEGARSQSCISSKTVFDDGQLPFLLNVLSFSSVQKYKTIRCSLCFSDTFPCFNFLAFSACETSFRLQNIKLHSKEGVEKASHWHSMEKLTSKDRERQRVAEVGNDGSSGYRCHKKLTYPTE